ncbi:ImmA/IrrE family metallo-endopeptidase [uncultured Tateyamaria sp.]|uniref:ImmA/IrrE family metallo-endopeptidase n=1 Tax=uncultured Tateyamaria sp. TaxID=455651 RepID=UPI0026133843|nr:ImmA/IrrE family metallo-endopeptidase [uncultured Tateyamaria sp.]
MTAHSNIVKLNARTTQKARAKRITSQVRKHKKFEAKILEFQKSANNSLVELAESLGLPVVKVALPGNLAGFLYPSKRTTPSGWEIVVNESLGERELRWTIAHELSHWVLDKDCMPPEFDDEQVLPRIRGDLENYIVERVEVRLDKNRSVSKAWCVGDPFITEFEDILESEMSANFLAGFILLPTPELFCRMTRGETVATISKRRCVPEKVVRRQTSYIRKRLQEDARSKDEPLAALLASLTAAQCGCDDTGGDFRAS